MGMVVRSNVMAVNAFRQLGMNNSQVSKSLEKLSSGFRINRAGDDASGLAISEKMKAQIKGLETASSNCQDGISLIQTAEGALTEVHDMLNRMVELCGKAANGTMDSVVDRPALQNEIVELRDEIDRIAKGTNFNGTFLLNGNLAGTAAADGAGATTQAAAETVPVDITGTWNGAAITPQTVAATKGEYTFTHGVADDTAVDVEIKYTDATGAEKTATLTGVKGTQTDGTDFGAALKTAIEADAGLKDLFTVDVTTDATPKIVAKTAGAGKGTITGVKVGAADKTVTPKAGADAYTTVDLGTDAPKAGDEVTIDGKKYTFDANADGTDGATFKDLATLKVAAEKNGVTLDTTTGTAVTATKEKPAEDNAAGGGLVLQIGDTAEDYNKMSVTIQDMSCESLGIADIDISTQTGASSALALIRGNMVNVAADEPGEGAATQADAAADGADAAANKKGAINLVSEARAKLGALQNRLEHTINNLDVAAENMTAANSRIRDTDMAKQMMEYTKMNVLTQAAQAMLAQANQQPQSVLQLLQ